MVRMKGRDTMNIKKGKAGFTIIEVVLVLAIAGLIFMMVFVALPALQRSQRDTARKNDVSIVSAAVTSYSSSNNGKFPTTAQLGSYVTEVSENTILENITVAPNTTIPTSGVLIKVEDSAIRVIKGSKCGTSDKDNQQLLPGTTRQYTVVTKLESGNGAHFCLGN